jgi:hypothetical protein
MLVLQQGDRNWHRQHLCAENRKNPELLLIQVQEKYVEAEAQSEKGKMGGEAEMKERMIVLSRESKNTNTKRLLKKIMKLVFDLQPIVNASEEIEIVLKAEDEVLKKRLELIKKLVKDQYEIEVIEG